MNSDTECTGRHAVFVPCLLVKINKNTNAESVVVKALRHAHCISCQIFSSEGFLHHIMLSTSYLSLFSVDCEKKEVKTFSYNN